MKPSLLSSTLAALIAGTSAQVIQAQALDSVALPTLTYEGVLKIGNQAVTGTYVLKFSILDRSGHEQWNSGDQSVGVSNGL